MQTNTPTPDHGMKRNPWQSRDRLAERRIPPPTPRRRICRVATLAILILSSAALGASQAEPPPPSPAEAEPHDAQRMHRNASQKRRSGGTHWLQDLREANPALYAQAQQMRKQDPAAFGQWMRNHMQSQRRAALLERHPALRDFLATLSPAARDALEEDLFRMHPPPRRFREKPDDAPPPTEQPRGKIDLEQFDAHTRHYEEQIQRAEERLEKLRDLLEKRRALRDRLATPAE